MPTKPVPTLFHAKALILILLFLPFTARVHAQQITPGPLIASPGEKVDPNALVSFYPDNDFTGVPLRLPIGKGQSVQNLTNRITSFTVPKGIRVKFYDGRAANDAVADRVTYFYPGNYPQLGGWNDKVDFVDIELMASINEPVAYFYDEQQLISSPRQFQGLGVGSYLDKQLICNDCIEAIRTVGLIYVYVYRDNEFRGESAGPFSDPDGLGNLQIIPGQGSAPGPWDEVSSVIITPRTDASPAKVNGVNLAAAQSDYYADLNFSVQPPSANLCNCPNDAGRSQTVSVTSDDILAPAVVTQNNRSPWQGLVRVPLGPDRKDVSANFAYDSGDYAGDCFNRCGYAFDERLVTLGTAALKAPRLDSFLVVGNGQIELHWTKLSDVPDDQITVYVKRNGQRIATLDGGVRSFVTDDFPGSGPYDYTIEIEAFNQNATSEPLRISAPVGIFTGTVATRPGGLTGTITGVRNVEVCAIQENDLPGLSAGTRYCDITDEEGNYRIENIYFGEEANFRIVPSKSGHGFDPDFRTRTLTPQISIERSVNFTDTTSFVLSGRIVQPGDGGPCPVGGVDILINGTFLGDQTDAEGNFVLSVPQAGAFSIRPRLADHVFEPAEVVLQVEADSAGINFEDLTRRKVAGYVLAGCEQFIGQAQVRIFSQDNCLDTTLTTSLDSGYFEIDLPARSFDVEVVDLSVLPGSDLDAGEVVGFLATQKIDLTERDTLLNFTYRQIPKIEIRGLDGPACAALPYPILEQLEQIQLEIEVWEEVNVCPVDTGVLRVVDRISVPNRELDLPIQNGIARYTVEATEPNIIAPYLKSLSLTADVDGRLGDKQVDVIVTGVRSREKTFATVTPELPLLILRDPPGDASSSYLQQNATFEAATGFSAVTTNASNIWEKLKVGTKFEVGLGYTTEVSVWGEIGGSATVSGATKNNEEFLTTLITGETFSTSNEEIVTGTEGDVFLGAAMNVIYALADEIIYNASTCSIETDTTLIMGTDGFATTYIYTEDHIRNALIPQLNQLVSLNRITNPDTAAFFQNQASVWEQTLQRNEELKRKARFVENRSFSGNAPYEAFTTASSTEKIAIEYTDVIDTQVALEAGLEVAGVGFSLGTRYTFRMETGVSSTQTETRELRTGYILRDDDQGDFFSVDIKTDPVYNTPVFELVSGRSSCPFEPGTQPREGAQLEAVDLVQTNVDPDGQAVFRLLLGNTSQSEESRIYQLKFNQASNPDGAVIKVGGSEVQGPINYTIPAGSQAEATVTVERGPIAYSYQDLEFSLVSFCDTSISNSILLSAYFQSDCSPITLRTPEPEWVLSTADAGMQTVQLSDYEKDQLDRVSIEYAAYGSSNWETLRILQPIDLSNLPGGTQVSLDLSSLPEGRYQLRARLSCDQGFVYSESVAGRVDRTPPQVFGTPEPTDDEYARGEELSITFDEPVNCLFVNAGNVVLRRAADSLLIPVSVGCADNQLLFRPDQDLFTQFGEAYTIQVSAIEDLYGNRMADPITWSFTIGGGAGSENTDLDGDGVPNALDNCLLAANGTQRDMDGDGIGDACDDDLDGDGIPNLVDNAPYHPNPEQVDTDGDGIGDAAEAEADGDGDGIANQFDNCPNTSNPDQADTDGDGIGDVCDDDIDNDGLINTVDNCPTLPNSLQEDVNGDGVGDLCEGVLPVDETLLFQHLHIYPNPTSEAFYVEVEPVASGRYVLELFSPTGQKIQSMQTGRLHQRTTFSFEVNQLPAGLYLLKLSGGGRSFGKRILVR